MKALLFYILQVIVCSGLLYGYYHFFLRNKKFHQYNRYYLLLTVVVSIGIPFLQIPVYFDAAETEPVFIKTLTVFSSGSFNEEFIVSSNVEGATWFTWKNILSSLYILAGVLLFIRFIISLLYVWRLTRVYPGEKIDNIRFINTDEPSSPFSFFRWLFWNRDVELNSDQGQQIFRHELFHIRQKHSWDIMTLEVITIIFWVNPFFHLLKKEIKAIHEFLADQFAVQENREWDYAELLLMQVLKSPGTRLTNPFFHNQIKRRIAMLTSSKKPGYQYLRKIMVLPMAAVVVVLFAFSYKHKEAAKKKWSDEPITIVVDAAHGGSDPGAKSPDKDYTEAGLSLEIAKVIQAIAKEYNVKVVMTRESDVLPGGAVTKDEGLKNRMAITKKSNAYAFISIHLNSAVPAEKYQEKLSGIEAYVSNTRNDEKGKKLASFMLNKLASVYKTQQELKYRSQNGIWVLDQTDCPAVLLECGFINNKEDLDFITNKDNQEKIARNILSSIVAFKSKEFEMAATITADTMPSRFEKKSAFFSHPDKIILQADSLIYHKIDGKTHPQIFQKSLVIINDKKSESAILSKKTIIAEEIHFYSKGDPEAIRLYGNEAAEGLLIFKNAKLINIPPAEYYKEELKPALGNPDNIIFEKLEIEPAFKGGYTAWSEYLKRNLDSNIPVKNGAPAGHYTVYIQFIVDRDGKISDVKPLTKHGYGMEQEAIRVIKNGPSWIPGSQNGKIVKAYTKQPINFIIPKANQANTSLNPENISPNNEVVVVGYSTNKSSKSNEGNKEVVVIGHPGSKSNKSNEENKEIVVVGYPSKKTNDNIIFEQVETKPSFPGGDAAWRKYLEKNINAAIPVDSGASAGVYKVIIQFVVKVDGSVTEIKPLTNNGYGMEKEAVRLIQNSSAWIPATQNGKKVNAYHKQPITFVIQEEETPVSVTESMSTFITKLRQ